MGQQEMVRLMTRWIGPLVLMLMMQFLWMVLLLVMAGLDWLGLLARDGMKA